MILLVQLVCSHLFYLFIFYKILIYVFIDAHVGRNLFDQCLKGILKEKTRVLITHQLQYLSEVDRILVLKEAPSGSTVAEFGTLHIGKLSIPHIFTRVHRNI
jgi:hypothetical protein